MEPAPGHLLTVAPTLSARGAVLGLRSACRVKQPQRGRQAAVTGTAWPAFLHLGTALLQEHFIPAPHTDRDAAFIFPQGP